MHNYYSKHIREIDASLHLGAWRVQQCLLSAWCLQHKTLHQYVERQLRYKSLVCWPINSFIEHATVSKAMGESPLHSDFETTESSEQNAVQINKSKQALGKRTKSVQAKSLDVVEK